METWGLGGIEESLPGISSMCAEEDIADLVDAIGQRSFPGALLSVLKARAGIELLSAYNLDRSRVPRMYFSASTGPIDVSGNCFRAYQTGLYLTDQTFDEAKELAQRSLAAVTHWHESEFPAPHRTAIYTRHEILERLSIVQNASEAKTEGRGYLALNLYRFRSKGHLASREIESTQREAKTLMACVRKHIEICSMHVGRRSPGAALKDACPALTERELQVCVRLIRGLTYEGIGADLGLSLASVKTYRARAYERLGIHFKSQLLSVAGILD